MSVESATGHVLVPEVGQEASRRRKRISPHLAIGNARQLQEHHDLDDERARIRRAEKRSKSMEGDHGRSPSGGCADKVEPAATLIPAEMLERTKYCNSLSEKS